jgi:FkbM family methyltransferase
MPHKKIFLDLGTNFGQGLKQFDKKFNLLNHPDWLIYCFEPNNNIKLCELFPNVSNITYKNKAVWIEDTILKFRKQGHKKKNLTGIGSKLECVEKKSNPANCYFKLDRVVAIDFARFLQELVIEHPDAEIYVKMDIEGAEFQVIDHLIHSNTIQYIKELYCECHGRFRFSLKDQKLPETQIEIQRVENDLKKRVENCGVTFNFWH